MLSQNRRHKVLNRKLGILKIDKNSTDLVFHFSIWAAWSFVCGTKPIKAPVAAGLCWTSRNREIPAMVVQLRDQNAPEKISETGPACYTQGKATQGSTKDQVQ